MKDYIKLSKVTGRLYLAMFITAFVCMLINTIFICVDRSNVRIGESIEHKITTEINKEKSESADKTYSMPEKGLDLSVEICDKALYDGGYLLTVFGIIFLLFVRRLSFSDVRAREFEMTFPVKKSSLFMYEYWFFFIMITCTTFIQGIILRLYQTHYNKVWAGILGKNVPDGFVTVPNDKLFKYTAIYALLLLLAFTWVYLGMILCKNPLLGIVISCVVWFGLSNFDISGILTQLLLYIFVGKFPIEYDDFGHALNYNQEVFLNWQNKENVIGQIMNVIFYPCSIFDYIDNPVEYAMTANTDGIGISSDMSIPLKNASPVLLLFILIFMLIAGIIIIRVLSGKKHLTNGGRIFNFRFAEWLVAVLAGIIWFVFEIYNLLDYLPFFNEDFYNTNNGTVIMFCIITSCIVAVIVRYLLDPFKTKQINDNYTTKRSLFSNIMTLNIPRVIAASLAGICIAYTKLWNDFLLFSNCKEACYEDGLNDLSVIINNYVYWVVFFLIAILVISKSYKYWLERKNEARDFFETLPELRVKKKIKSIISDIFVVIIPIIFSGIYISLRLENVLEITTEIKLKADDYNSLVMLIREKSLVSILYMFMLIGLIHLMEEMFANGLMRPVGYVGAMIMIASGVNGAVRTFKNTYIDDDINNLLTMNNTNGKMIGNIIFYVVIGTILIILSFILAKKKEHSSNVFYFNFEKYLFSFFISVTVFFMAQPYIVAMWHRILILLSCVFMYLMLVYLMTPKDSRTLGRLHFKHEKGVI